MVQDSTRIMSLRLRREMGKYPPAGLKWDVVHTGSLGRKGWSEVIVMPGRGLRGLSALLTLALLALLPAVFSLRRVGGLGTGVEEIHGVSRPGNHDLGGVAVLSILPLPFAGAQRSLDVDQTAFGQVVPAKFR